MTRLIGAVLVLAWSSLVAAQAIEPDTIDFTTADDWVDLKKCAQCVLQTCYTNVAYEAGCVTNACLCQRSTLGDAVQQVSSAVVSKCSNLDDATIAVSVLTAYCSGRGYTEVLLPTTLQSSGASTVTVTAATVTVTRLVSVSPPPLGPSSVTAGAAAALALAVAGGPFAWMLLRQRLRVRV